MDFKITLHIQVKPGIMATNNNKNKAHCYISEVISERDLKMQHKQVEEAENSHPLYSFPHFQKNKTKMNNLISCESLTINNLHWNNEMFSMEMYAWKRGMEKQHVPLLCLYLCSLPLTL